MKKLVNIFYEKIRIKHFAIFFLISVPITGYLLRQNNLNAIELRNAVLQIDEETGDINQVAPSLEELGNFILNHMNTNIGSVELPGTFNTAVELLRKEAEASGSANSGVYARAQLACEDPNVLLTARAQCVQDFIISNAKPGTDARELDFPDKSLFSYSFASPSWSPDFAGISLLLSALSLVCLSFLVLTRGLLPFLSRIIDKDPLE